MTPILSRLPQRSRLVQLGLVTLMLGASLLILGTLVWRERETLLTYDWFIQWGDIGLAFALLLLGLITAAMVWADLMIGLGSRIHFIEHARIYCMAHLARRLPGTLWYVAGRGVLYKQRGESLRTMALASSLELVIMVLAGVVVTLAFFSVSLRDLPRVYPVALGALLLLSLTALHPRSVHWLLQRLPRAVDAEQLPVLGIWQIGRWVVSYATIWIVGGAVFFLVARSITSIGMNQLAYLIGGWSLVGTLSITVFFLPSNLGFTEVGLALLLANLVPSSLAVLIALLLRIALLLFELVAVMVILGALCWKTSPSLLTRP